MMIAEHTAPPRLAPRLSAGANIALEGGAPHIGRVAVPPARVADAKARLRAALAQFSHNPPPLCRLAPAFSVADVLSLVASLPSSIRHMAILGTGGSTLCPQALTGALGGAATGGRRAVYIDNVDYGEIAPILAGLPPHETLFVAISKSGNTLETLAQYMLCVNHFRAAAPSLKVSDHFLAISDPAAPGKKNRLRELSAHYGVRVIDHEENGGRFAIFTAVGLLPAAFAGADARTIMQGAQEAAARAFAPDSPAATAALYHYLAEGAGYGVDILMSYSYKLRAFMAWLAQIRAESLGKNGYRLTPVTSVGTLDQHSQLQLFLDGAPNKLFSIFYERQPSGAPLGHDVPAGADMEHLRGKCLSSVLLASARATAETLAAAKSPVRIFSPQHIDARYIGELAMECMIETLLIAALLGVDPYSQPAVEAGKLRAAEMLREE